MAPRSKNLLERFLSLFTEVRSGEGINAILLCVNIFLILTAYYIIKPVREALILTEGGAELKSYLSAGIAVLLVFVAVPLYSKIASRFTRRRLINVVTIFFAACLVLFFILAQFNVPLGVIFFIWIGIFNLMVIAQFWSFANDLYTPEAGKRIFVIVAFGMSAGAVFGSFISGRLFEPLGVFPPMLLSSALLLVSCELHGQKFSYHLHIRREVFGNLVGRKLAGAGNCHVNQQLGRKIAVNRGRAGQKTPG